MRVELWFLDGSLGYGAGTNWDYNNTTRKVIAYNTHFSFATCQTRRLKMAHALVHGRLTDVIRLIGSLSGNQFTDFQKF